MKKDNIVRFSVAQRIEHIVLMVSFTLLAVTGITQKFHTSEASRWLMSIMGGIDMVRILHHVAAVVLGMGMLYHVLVIGLGLFWPQSRRLPMLPRLKDFRDARQMVLYLAGRRNAPPEFDRYDFRQKLEYWALVWGVVLMGITGLILLFPTAATFILPGVLIPVSKVVHGYEALLSVAAIAIWHMYSAHWAADVFPIDVSIFTGRISRHRLLTEHPLEYRYLLAQEESQSAVELRRPE